MVKAHIYLEGGGDSKDGKSRCREGFRKLLQKCGFAGRMPKLIACGGRDAAYDDFKTRHLESGDVKFIALLVDSEDTVQDKSRPWDHLSQRDNWIQPPRASDDQVFLMTTCMETWIASDRNTLLGHFGHCLQSNALPPLHNLEGRLRQDVERQLRHATRECDAPYEKGPKSFDLLGKLDPTAMQPNLPSFVRMREILDGKL